MLHCVFVCLTTHTSKVILCHKLAWDCFVRLQVSELQKKAVEVKTLLERNCQLADSMVGDKGDKKEYIKEEKENQAKLTRLQGEIDSIVPTF